MKCAASEELKKIPGLIKRVRKRYNSLVKAGLIKPEMRCLKCKGFKVAATCDTFKKGVKLIWTGNYCLDCGHWWKKEESNE